MARAFGTPHCVAQFRQNIKDFKVEETLSFEPTGTGQHWLVQVEKINNNTQWTAQTLARFVGVRTRDVGYAGLKDRRAQVLQWFSVPAGKGAEPKWSSLVDDGIRVVQHHRHKSKLRRGAIKHNAFEILVHMVEGEVAEIEQRALHIDQEGVPNYFGNQRFGNDGSNLSGARQWFVKEQVPRPRLRGLYLSAARSLIFNQILSQRVLDCSWSSPLLGDRMILQGSRSHFHVTELDQILYDRTAEHDIHPSGALWGAGELGVTHEVAELEKEVAGRFDVFAQGLVRNKLEQERRALRVRPERLKVTSDTPHSVSLEFELPTGSFATSVLRELFRSPGQEGV
ncbi:MAG: tRNA pseudouridine(13) synthase TruD [Pseudomonadota bacterium]